MTVLLIRHGKTAGNLLGRYIGKTDEPLCPQGAEELTVRAYPAADGVFCSPLRRCRETAALLYPHLPATPVSGLEECDFGAFEGKSYRDLNGDPDYQRWIDSNGVLPFPGGESRTAFIRRSVTAFVGALAGFTGDTAAFVVHGGTIMAVMSTLSQPPAGFYDFQVKNAGGYAVQWDGHTLTHPEVLP
ncbi:histidine phosphatase family protein [Acutalibacter caecimuris]|uniref:histidine phosphatase family protein n=1 Tax=Acutalibacter caecimuris TaxID=3093657 RepID=UPI002AC8AF31|nr:histidine phosphatase family protein [Acutalibacter sp. M00118]